MTSPGPLDTVQGLMTKIRPTLHRAGLWKGTFNQSNTGNATKKVTNLMTFHFCYFYQRKYKLRILSRDCSFSIQSDALHVYSACHSSIYDFSTLRRSSITSPLYPLMVSQQLSGPARTPDEPAWPGHYPSPSAHLRSWSSSFRALQEQPRSTG